MRRPLLVLVLLATIAISLPKAGFAKTKWPSSGSKSPHASRVQKLARRVVGYARHQLGVPYSWGGTSRATGFDCSGWCTPPTARSAGRSRGRLGPAARRPADPLRAPAPGDLLFTEGGGHVQLVVSKRAAISAPQTGERVRYVPLAQLRPEFAGARRVLR
jgi:cell wall-associated NlpC family hydrolase